MSVDDIGEVIELTAQEELRNPEIPDDSQIKAMAQAGIRDAQAYNDSELAETRLRAMQYFKGEITDLDDESDSEDKSQFVSQDVADTIGFILPGLMRVFTGSGTIVTYGPRMPGDEEGAEQATDYVNYKFWADWEGYRVLWDAFHDALLLKNGVIKHWWDDTPELEYYVQTGMTQDELMLIQMDPDVEIVEMAENAEEIEPGVIIPLFDVKIQRTLSRGKMVMESVPPEDFLVERTATSLKQIQDDKRFAGHKTVVTRSDLIEEGYPRDLVDTIPGFPVTFTDEEYNERHEESWIGLHDNFSDDSMVQVERYECYFGTDVNDDGIAETIRVIMAGDDGGVLLDWEVWEDDYPFTDLVPERIPHRWEGRSTADDTMDIQKTKSAVGRQMLNNLYQTNMPQKEMEEGSVTNMDEVVNPTLGGTIMRKRGTAPITYNTVPFMGDAALGVMNWLDDVVHRRTGVTQQSMALDPDALQNQSATAVNAMQTASYSKIELIARNFAEMGLRRLFQQLLKLLVKHQDRQEMIRLRGEWVPMDPRSWNASMDTTINVGQGTGSRERDVMMLRMVLADQFRIVEMLGMGNPITMQMLPLIRNTLARIVEASGLKDADQYYPEITDDDMLRLIQDMQNQPNPEVEKLKADMAKEEMKITAQRDKEAAQMQADLEVERARLEANMLEKEQDRQADMQKEGQKQVLEREKMATDAEFKDRELDIKEKELALKQALFALQHGSDVEGALSGDVRKNSPTVEAMGVMREVLEGFREAITELVEASNAPRELVRDEKTGRPVGMRVVRGGKK